MDSVEVYVEVDNTMYTFPTDEAVELWVLNGEETYSSVRDATPEDQEIAGLLLFAV